MAAVSVKGLLTRRNITSDVLYTHIHIFLYFFRPFPYKLHSRRAHIWADSLLNIIHNDYFEAMWAVRLRPPVTPFMAPLKNYESALVVDIEICTMGIILQKSLLLFSIFESPIIPSTFSKAPLNHQFCMNVYFQMLLVLRTVYIFPKEFEIVGGQEEGVILWGGFHNIRLVIKKFHWNLKKCPSSKIIVFNCNSTSIESPAQPLKWLIPVHTILSLFSVKLLSKPLSRTKQQQWTRCFLFVDRNSDFPMTDLLTGVTHLKVIMPLV